MLQLLTGLLDQHGDTAQQAALLAYLRQGEEAQPYLEVGDCQILSNIVKYLQAVVPTITNQVPINSKSQ